MKREKIFFGVGCLMVLVAIGFMVFALNHPEMSFPWSNNITYVIYVVYLVVTIFMFCISKKTKKKQEKERGCLKTATFIQLLVNCVVTFWSRKRYMFLNCLLYREV